MRQQSEAPSSAIASILASPAPLQAELVAPSPAPVAVAAAEAEKEELAPKEKPAKESAADLVEEEIIRSPLTESPSSPSRMSASLGLFLLPFRSLYIARPPQDYRRLRQGERQRYGPQGPPSCPERVRSCPPRSAQPCQGESECVFR